MRRGFDSPQLHDALNGHLPGLLAGVTIRQVDLPPEAGSLTRCFVEVTDGGVQPPSTQVVLTSLQLSDGGDKIWRSEGGKGRMPPWIVITEHCSGAELARRPEAFDRDFVRRCRAVALSSWW